MLERKITPKQRKYLNFLLSKHFEGDRNLYLRLSYEVNSLRELSFEQAGEMIDKFSPSNVDVDLNVSEAFEKIEKHTGRKKLL